MQLRATTFAVFNVLYVFVVFYFSCFWGVERREAEKGGKEEERRMERDRSLYYSFKSMLEYDRFSRVKISFRYIY